MALPTKLTLEIVTPERSLVSQQVDEVQFDCEDRTFRIESRRRSEFDGKHATTPDTSGENFLFGKKKSFSLVEDDAAMPLLGHFACGMWGPK